MVLIPDGRLAVITGNNLTGPNELFPEGPARDAMTLAYDTEDSKLVWKARYSGPLQRWDTGDAIAISSDGAHVLSSAPPRAPTGRLPGVGT